MKKNIFLKINKFFNRTLILFFSLMFLCLWISKVSAAVSIGDIKEYTAGNHPVPVSFTCPSPYVLIEIANPEVYNAPYNIRCARVYVDGQPVNNRTNPVANKNNQWPCAGDCFFCDNNQFLAGMNGVVPMCATYYINGGPIKWSEPWAPCATTIPPFPGILGPLSVGSIWYTFTYQHYNLNCSGTYTYPSPPVTPPPGSFSLSGSSSCSGTTRQTNTLTWTASANASYYYVYRDGNRVATRYPGNESFSETINAGTHTYRVTAYNAAGSLSRSVTISARDCAPPGTPLLTVTPSCDGNQSVNRLSWTAASGATNYYVYRCEKQNWKRCNEQGNFNRCSAISSALPPSQTTYNDNVNYPSEYEYYIRAYKSTNSTNSYSEKQRVCTKCCAFIDIKYFRANPTTIKSGQSTRLEWDTVNTETLTINQGIGNVSVPSGRTGEIFPSDTTTYTLSATGICPGDTQQATATVNVGKIVYRGMFIGEKIIIKTSRDYLLRILYDPRTINNPPPGFSDILAPLIKEVAP